MWTHYQIHVAVHSYAKYALSRNENTTPQSAPGLPGIWNSTAEFQAARSWGPATSVRDARDNGFRHRKSKPFGFRAGIWVHPKSETVEGATFYASNKTATEIPQSVSDPYNP
jgi:hypothetical protein